MADAQPAMKKGVNWDLDSYFPKFNGPEMQKFKDQLKQDLKVTVRCIPFEKDPEPGTCIFTSKPSRQRVVFAKSY